jgi:hypothetical protein
MIVVLRPSVGSDPLGSSKPTYELEQKICNRLATRIRSWLEHHESRETLDSHQDVGVSILILRQRAYCVQRPLFAHFDDFIEPRLRLVIILPTARSPVIAQTTKRGKLQTKLGSVFCNDGDVVLAVRWLVRDESDAERRTFYEPSDEDEAGSVIPVNSTELRHAGFGLTVLEPSIRTACNAELESDVEDGGDVNGEDEWEDDDGESGDEVIDDRIEEDSAYVHGRRLVLSVADEQTALDRCW